MKKSPFAFVLYLEHPNAETTVGICATLEDIEKTLRNNAASRWAGLRGRRLFSFQRRQS
jgi:hypothetical protein